MGWIEDSGTILHCMGVTLLHRITQLQRIMFIKNLYDEPQDVHSCIQFVFIKGTIACNGSKHA